MSDTPARTPVVIDTDPGIDDAVAILLALASPELEPRAITTVFGNADLETTTTNARRLLALAGRTDVPVAAGAARPLVRPFAGRGRARHHEDGLGGQGRTLPPPGPLHPSGAVELVAGVLRAADRQVTVVSIGPMTNIARLLANHPGWAGKIGRIVAMGGAVHGGDAESNVRRDPEAAHRVLAEETVPVTLVPLELTLRCAVDGTWLDALAAAGPLCSTLGRIIEHYRALFRAERGRDGAPLHDAVAMLEAALPGTLRTEPASLRVECAPGQRRGTVSIGAEPSGAAGGRTRPVDLAVDTDVSRLHAELLCRLRTLDDDQ